MARTYYLNRYQFDEIYHRLAEYANPGKMGMSYDECAKNALKFIKDNKIIDSLPNEINEIFGEGYRLVFRNRSGNDTIRVIWITPNMDRIFYEGVTNLRFINDINVIDYFTLSIDEMESLIEKYHLVIEDSIKLLLREVIMRNNLTFPENEQDEKWFNEGINAREKHGAELFIKIHEALGLGDISETSKKKVVLKYPLSGKNKNI